MSEPTAPKEQHQPPFNTQPAGLEKAVANFYTRTINLNLPVGGRKWLADNVWWLALLGGVLSALAALQYWNAAHALDALGFGSLVPSLGAMWYVALGVMLAEAVLLLVAFQPLKDHKKSGWNLLFYLSLVSIALGVLYLFVPYYGVGGLIGMVIGTLIGWFFLFQIRSYFTK